MFISIRNSHLWVQMFLNHLQRYIPGKYGILAVACEETMTISGHCTNCG
jgi:ubiquitin C-terminal hydrolase